MIARALWELSFFVELYLTLFVYYTIHFARDVRLFVSGTLSIFFGFRRFISSPYHHLVAHDADYHNLVFSYQALLCAKELINLLVNITLLIICCAKYVANVYMP